MSGAAGSNECPAGAVRIETEAACRTAVAAAGKPLYAIVWGMETDSVFVETNSDLPRGCYYTTSSNYAWFNTHAVGAGDSYSQLLCAAVTTGAPLTSRCVTRVHCAGGASNNANGLNIDTHAYIDAQICPRMVPTALAGGAARRTAAQADGGRACTGAARKGT